MEDRVAKICANCKSTENVRNCARCGDEGYCSKECQREHYPKHKAQCKFWSKVKKAAENAENGNGNPGDVMTAILKGTKKMGVETTYVTFTHAGCVSSSDKDMPRGVPAGFPLIKKATYEYASHHHEGRQYGEAAYKKLYDDLVQNEKEWLKFFEHPLNQSHAGDTSMVLAELVEIYSGRKSYEEMGGALDMLEKTLHFCKERSHIEDQDDREMRKAFYDKTEFSMLNFRYDLNEELGRFEANIPIFKVICDREISHNIPKRVFNEMWATSLAVLNALEGKNLRAKSVHDLSNEVILRVMQIHDTTQKMLNATSPAVREQMERDLGMSLEDIQNNKRDVQLKLCANCKKQESACGDFRVCKCKKVCYCGRACQRRDKKHRKVCTAA